MVWGSRFLRIWRGWRASSKRTRVHHARLPTTSRASPRHGNRAGEVVPSPCSSTAAGATTGRCGARKQGRGRREQGRRAWICRFAGQGDEEDEEPVLCGRGGELRRCRPPPAPRRFCSARSEPSADRRLAPANGVPGAPLPPQAAPAAGARARLHPPLLANPPWPPIPALGPCTDPSRAPRLAPRRDPRRCELEVGTSAAGSGAVDAPASWPPQRWPAPARRGTSVLVADARASWTPRSQAVHPRVVAAVLAARRRRPPLDCSAGAVDRQ
jgi:hypothetical protein